MSLPSEIPADFEFCPRCRNPTRYSKQSDGPKQTIYARKCDDCGKRWGGISIRKHQNDPWQQLALFDTDDRQREVG